jgi:hypothetical protein
VSARRNSIAPVVKRRCLAETDACECAIKSLLKDQVNKAAEPASNADGRDDYERLANKERSLT